MSKRRDARQLKMPLAAPVRRLPAAPALAAQCRTVQFRLTPAQRTNLETIARAEADTLSNFVRRTVLRAAGWNPRSGE